MIMVFAAKLQARARELALKVPNVLTNSTADRLGQLGQDSEGLGLNDERTFYFQAMRIAMSKPNFPASALSQLNFRISRRALAQLRQ